MSYEGKSKPLAYDSELTVVRGETTGKALVDWKPAVVHPELKDGDTLVTGESASPAIEAVDRNNVVLTKEKYPSLGPILDALREKYGDTAGGSPASSCRPPRERRHRRHHPGDSRRRAAGKVRTTLSASAQAAAEKAVSSTPSRPSWR